MSVGQKIYDMVESMMFGANIDSPRFDDYKIYAVESDPGLIKQIDDEIGGNNGFGKAPSQLRTRAQMEKRFRDFMKNAGSTASPVAGAASGGILGMLTAQIGIVQARQAMMMLANPQKMIAKTLLSKKLLQGTAVLGKGATGFGNLTPGSMMKAGGILALIWFVLNSRPFIEAITRQMTKRGGIFDKTFRNKTNTLQNALRNREQQQSIRSGFTQVIFTTNGGTTDPRDAYNTYEQTIHDEVKLTNLRNIRSVGNVVP